MSQIEFFENRVNSTFSPMDYIQVAKQNADNYLLIDVRNGPAHLRKEKIQGAVEIPLSELENRFLELPKDKTLILYCWDVWCNTAAKAAVILLKNGYEVRELSGGIAAWKAMNFPTSSLEASEIVSKECGC